MVFLVKKEFDGRIYLYLRHNHRIKGKVKVAWEIYLGSEKDFKTHAKIAKLDIKTETIDFGLIAALLHVAEKLGLVDVINQATNKREQGFSVGEHLLFAALNRCVQPTSKKRLREWINSTVLRKFFSTIEVNMDSRAYWTHFHYLSDDAIEVIENKLVHAIRDRFGVQLNELSFDPTNFFTYINPRTPNQTLPHHGHSKEGRFTLNIVNVSLFCALDGGVPLFHLIYPGNVQDASHFKEAALPRLKRRLEEQNVEFPTVTLIFDKGNLSQEGFDLIDDWKCDYICSDRPSTHKDLLNIPAEEFELHVLPNGNEIGVKDFHLDKYGKTRRFIAVYNPNEEKWNHENFKKKIQKRISEIDDYFKNRLVFAPGEKRKGQGDKWRIRAEVEKKINAMIGGSPFAEVIVATVKGPSKLPVSKGGRLELEISSNPEELKKVTLTLGKSFLMTSREDLSADKVVWIYRQQYLVERAFKWLKNSEFLSIRPMYHRVDSSIRGHVFVCYLGLVLLSLLVREITQLGVPMSINKAITHLKEIRMTQIKISGKSEPLKKIDEMSQEARKLYQILNLSRYL
jgi:transposase